MNKWNGLQPSSKKGLAIRGDLKSVALIKSHGQQLSKLKREQPLQLISMIVFLIEQIYELANVGKRLSDSAMATTAEMIVEEYYYLKLEEIQLVFKNGAIGKYGKIYDRIDASVIFDWLLQYDTSEASIAVSEKRAANFKSIELNKNPTDKEVFDYNDFYKTGLEQQAKEEQAKAKQQNEIINSGTAKNRYYLEQLQKRKQAHDRLYEGQSVQTQETITKNMRYLKKQAKNQKISKDDIPDAFELRVYGKFLQEINFELNGC